MSDQNYIRQQREAERIEAINTDRGSWLTPFAAGIGTIALGAVLLKNRIANNGKLLSNIFNFLGLPRGVSLATDIAANSGKSSINSGTTGIRSLFNATFNFKTNKIQLGPIDIIDDLRTSIELIGNPTTKKEIADSIKERTIEYTNRSLVGYGNNTGYFTQGLERVTVGNVLDDQAAWSNALGVNQVGILEKARSLGLIKDSMVLDKKLYFNPATQEVLDFRLRNLISSVKAVKAGNETVFQRVARFDIFGQGQVVASVLGANNRKIAVLGPGDGYAGSRLFFDGNVYGYQKVASGYKEVLLGTNRIIRKSGDPLEVIAASRQGRIETTLPERTGFFGGILSWMENTLGIGPGYANRPSFANRLLIDPYRRFQAIRSGEGTVFTHPFRREFQLNKAMDAALGGDLPELTRAGGAAVAVPGGGFATELANLGGRTRVLVPNRVGIMFDIVDNMSVIKEQAYRDYRRNARQTLVGDDLIVAPRKGGFQISGKNIPANSMANQITDIERAQLTAVGFKSKTNQYGYYDVQGTRIGGKVSGLLSGLQDFASYSVYRLNSLFSESLLGVGIRPDHRLLPNLLRAAAVPFVYEAGRQVGLYADYLSEKITGISPIKAVGSVYAGARIAQQKLRELTGIRAATDFLDTYFPGSINSDGATIARSIAAPIAVANALLKKGNMIGALIGAAATYAGIGGVEPNQTTSELIREYSGDKKVPIRKGRLWGLGYTPFFGGKAERYDYSWYAKLQSDYRTKSIYGSESEYWSYHANVFGVPLPTPSNLFGINNLLNPYRLESNNYNSRPYPQTESDLSKFPIFGPALNTTVGQLIKPVFYRTPTELPLLRAGLAEKGMTAKTAALFGMTNLEATSYEAEDPASAINTLMRQANIASEPLGIYKFVMEFFGVSVRPKIGTEYATSSTIQDPGRAFYDMSIGGMFGQTEAIRRFLINDYSSSYRRSAMINPIRNDMPTWLPGTYSENNTDRSYFLDLTMGDPFSKIQDGESRLPGAGYEALNELHSGKSGVYDDVDKFLILSDVAPYSAAYRKYEKSVLSMPLENEWATKVQEAIANRSEVIGVDTRYKRYQEDIIAMNMNTIAKSIYAPARKFYDFITHDVLAEIPYVGSKFFPFRNPEEQYRKTYVEGAEYASWDRPWEDIIRPSLYDMALEDPLTAAGKGAMLGFLASGPMRWFTPIRSLVGSAGAGMVNYGTVGLGAAFGAGLSTSRIAAGADQNFIPFHIREEEEAIQYMDAISYIKGSMVEQAGGGSMLKNKTFMGAKNVIGYRSALPRSADKKYFDYFMGIEDSDQRTQISRGLPDFMSVGLYKAWNQDFNTNEEADAEALAFINTNQIPDSNWLGWSPEVSSAATKLRFIEHGINGVSDNIHRFGFYESHEVDLQTRLRNFHNQEINYVQSPIYSSFDSFLNQQISGVSGGKMSVKRYSTPTGSRRDITIKAERAREDQELLRRISK